MPKLLIELVPRRAHCRPAMLWVVSCEDDTERVCCTAQAQAWRELRETRSEMVYIFGVEKVNMRFIVEGSG